MGELSINAVAVALASSLTGESTHHRMVQIVCCSERLRYAIDREPRGHF
jgi:hypothetical protein